MAIPRETVEQILQAARIEEVVGEFVTLKKRGSNMWGNCPFHNEKTPSFSVNPARNIFKCFGCGKAGDSAKFLMEHEHFSYPEALRYLAKKYNIKIEEKEQTAEEIMQQSLREKMFNINEFADKYFVDTLWNTDEGKTIGLEYFRERGYFDPIIQKFHLGYSPAEWDAFTKHAKQNGYNEELLEQIGLSIKGNKGLYDRYHGRVMFPIHSLTGRVIGFGGRILVNDKKSPKYQNSPESEIYDKKQTLYGIYFAKNAIAKNDECILVEGYFDVLRMHQIGIENVVASSGTSLTMEQIRLVKRYTKNITMLYDGDAAGIHAALRGTDMILSEGMNVRVVVLPPEHDPDTFGKEFSTEYVSNYLKENAKDFIRFKTELLLKDAENDPIKRGQVIRDIVETISVIPDSIFRITYVKECSRLLDMPEQTLTNELNKILRAKLKKTLGIENEVVTETDTTTVTQPKQEETLEEQLPAGYYQERELVKLLLMYGRELITDERIDEDGQKIYEQVTVAQFIIDDLKNDGFTFTNVVNKKIFDIFDHAIDEGRIPDDQLFVSHEDETIAQLAADLLSSPYKLDQWEKYGIFVKREENVLRTTVLSSIYRYKDLIIEERRKAIEEELKTTTDSDDQLILLKHKKDLDDIRKQINKELGIVIAK
ncbi:MAG: DNA primase [Bacteroidales bacterium]|nr:DNA primase [Bacteroidales bacterium]MBR6931524.1 DNA primase [Bacteroidales bacterium]MBR6931602.1 DNA primase [Bacteroidales bacterium]